MAFTRFFILCCSITCFLNATFIDIVADFSLGDWNIDFNKTTAAGYEVRTFHIGLKTYISEFYNPDVHKVVLMGDTHPPEQVTRLPKEKLILFVWEPFVAGDWSPYWKLFSRVYTHNDNWVNGSNYRKFYYPALVPMLEETIPFDKRKLCTIMCRNWTDKRLELLRFFQKKKADFTFYGTCPDSFRGSPFYGGIVPGIHSGKEKVEILSCYRFYLCFENTSAPGYISEKIFNCFTAGCIPVYLGAPNVTTYIPQDCFIDYRKFRSNEELYHFLRTMPEAVFNNYLLRIREYMESPKSYCFTTDYFDELICQIAIE